VRAPGRPSNIGTFFLWLTGSIPFVAALVLSGCGGKDEPIFVGIEERQAKEDEEQKNMPETDNASQR
jgi:hypothetical protein